MNPTIVGLGLDDFSLVPSRVRERTLLDRAIGAPVSDPALWNLEWKRRVGDRRSATPEPDECF